MHNNEINLFNENLIKEISTELAQVDIHLTMTHLKFAANNIKREIDRLIDRDNPDCDQAGCLLEHLLSITETIDLVRSIESRVMSHKAYVSKFSNKSTVQ